MTTNLKGVLGRSILIIGFSESVSGVGNWITMMAVFALVVFRGHGGVVESSGIMMAGLLPVFLVSPAAGWLCDRFDRRRLMIASELIQAMLVSVLIFASSLFVIYPVIALESAVGSVMTPARRSAVPQLVEAVDLPRVNAFFQQLNGSVKIGAPLLAGGLLAILDPHTAIIIDVVSFALSALLLSRLPSLRSSEGAAGAPAARGGEQSGRRSGRRSDRNGGVGTVIRGSAGLRLIFVSAFLAILVIVGFDILASVFVRDSLHAGEGVFGLFVSLVGIGTVGASVIIMIRRSVRDSWSDLLTGIALLASIPLSLAVSGLLSSATAATAVAAAGCLIGGIGNGLLTVQAGTLLQLLPPARLLGRTSGAFQSTTALGQLIGVVLTPVLVPHFMSMGTFFLLSFGALSLLVVWIASNLRSVRVTAAVPG